jgi:hypothetical protein
MSDILTHSFLSKRGEQFVTFAAGVLVHIEDYTVPQYGDMPDDQASSFIKEEIAMNMKRYLNRINSNQRGKEEALRDCLKLAHYACMLHEKVLASQD